MSTLEMKLISIYRTKDSVFFVRYTKNPVSLPVKAFELHLQNAPDCTDFNDCFKNFPGEHAPGLP